MGTCFSIFSSYKVENGSRNLSKMTFSVDKEFLIKCLHIDSTGNSTDNAEIIIKNYQLTEMKFSHGGNKMSRLRRINVEYECDGEPHKKSFIVKMHTYSLSIKFGYDIREVYLYEKILPKITEMLNEPIAPTHYQTIKPETLVLEDLTESGFEVVSTYLLNMEHSIVALQTLAKFHAASYKLQQQNSVLMSGVSHELFLTKDNVNNFLINFYYPAVVEVLKVGAPLTLIEKFQTFKDEIVNKSVFHTSNKVIEFNVLNHGNIKSDNILFKYNEKGEPVSAKFTDFQCSRWNSPATDIIWFASASLEFDVFEKHFDELLDSYLKTLNDTLETLGCGVKYTKDQLNSDMKNLKLFCIWVFVVCAYNDMKNVVMGVNNGTELALDSETIKIIREDKKFRHHLLWFKYYDENGVFDKCE